MDFISIKKKQKELIKNTILNNIYNTTFTTNNDLKKGIKNYINKIKLNKTDYTSIQKEIINNLQIKNQNILNIVNILNAKFKNEQIEYHINEEDPYIYININNIQSYLINFDEIEDTWYLALINSENFELLKEICEGNLDVFLSFLENNFN